MVCSSRSHSLGNPAWTMVISVPPPRGSNVNSMVVSKLDPSGRVSVEAIRIRRGRSITSNTWRWWYSSSGDGPNDTDQTPPTRRSQRESTIHPGGLLAVELALTDGVGEGIEDALGRGRDQPLEPELE